jgi:predicted flap endonuclease-1-like 5' DNA nuclease
VEWITNAAPSVEVTIEVDANDEEEELPECRAPVPSLDADDDERLATAAQASEFVVEIERAPALHAVETAGEDATAGDSSSTEAPCDGHFVARPDSEDLAAASDDSEITAEIVPRRDSEEFTATLLPNPETTLEIDPDHDLFDLEAELPPLTIPAPAAIGGKRKPPAKRRAPTKRDDFQQIEGVGKRLEQRLYAKGIRTYAQLAALRPAELTRLAKQIGVTPERIQREAWVAQAKRLRKSATTRKRAAASVPRKPKRARA